MEWSVFLYAALLCFDAWRRGPSWFMTLVLGFVAGVGVEAGIIRTPSPTNIYYCYPATFYRILGVPIWVGLGWGMILYASTWTAYRMKLSALPRALVAGALAANIDFSIDPVAHYLGFWTWEFRGWTPAFKFFEVPFDNFVAWFAIVAGYSLLVRAGFRFVERRWPRLSAKKWHWSDVVVPLLSVVLLLLVFSQLRTLVVTLIYDRFADRSCGQAVLFTVMFGGGAYFLWRNARQARRDQPISYIVLWVPLYFHFLMLGCVVFRNWQAFVQHWGPEASILLLLVPANLVVGLFAFAWPSLDVLLAGAKRVGLEQQKAKLIKLLKKARPSLAAQLQAYDPVLPASGNLTRLPSKLAELVLDPSPHADVLGGDAPLKRDGDEPLKKVADAVHRLLEDVLRRSAAPVVPGAGRFAEPVPRRFPPVEASQLEWDRFADALVIEGTAALEALPPPTPLERFRKETLTTYTGETVACWVCSPTTIQSLQDALQFAKDHDWRVTFRCGEHSFDVQSTNEMLVVSLEHFRDDEIFIDTDRGVAIVGAANTWSEILSATVARGFVPYVMPTAGGVTAGGSLSAHTICRASGFIQREGAHIEEFEMVVPDFQGQGRPALVRCSPDENADLFDAAIGGLGYAGAVVSITHRLLPLQFEPRARQGAPFDDVAVQTVYSTFRGLASLGAELRGLVAGIRNAPAAPADSSGVRAITASLFLHGPNRGILGTSTYVRCEKGRLKRSLFHSPHSFAHRLFQFMAHLRWSRILGYWFVLNCLIRNGRTFTDELHGYTFFEDGNVAVRRWSRKWGVPLGILQQTFVVPATDGDALLVAFLDEADRWMTANTLVPALLDVLYVPRDARRFHLSSSSELDAYIVSFSFEDVGDDAFDNEEEFLVQMTDKFSNRGVRLHLVKNVRGSREAVSAHYAAGIAAMQRVRAAHGAGFLRNEFSDRWLPGI